MKTKQLFFAVTAFILSTTNAFAYQFSAVSPSGHTLYYDFCVGGVEVVSKDGNGWNNGSGLTGDLIIPPSVTYNGTNYVVNYIGDWAFGFCRGLTSVTIPYTVDTFGRKAFYDCNSITTVYFTGTIAQWCDIYHNFDGGYLSRPYQLYIDNVEVINLEIPNGVTEIKQLTFYNCNSLLSITIPESVSTIGGGAFIKCENLNAIVFNPTNCTSMGYSNSSDSIFNGSVVTSLTIGNSVTNIPNNAFRGCSSLTSLTIPNSVLNIGEYAFKGCNHLTSITLGKSIQYVGCGAFDGCSQVQIVSAKSESPAVICGSSSFGFPDNCKLYIPCGTSSIYAMTAYWTRFFPDNVDEDLMYTFSASTAEPTKGTVQIITPPSCDNLEAQILASPYHNYRFDHWSDGNIANPRYLVVIQDTTIQAYFVSSGSGIIDVGNEGVNVFSIGNRIVVTGTSDKVQVFDMVGHMISNSQTPPIDLIVPTSGIYLVKIGNHTTHKIVVN